MLGHVLGDKILVEPLKGVQTVQGFELTFTAVSSPILSGLFGNIMSLTTPLPYPQLKSHSETLTMHRDVSLHDLKIRGT